MEGDTRWWSRAPLALATSLAVTACVGAPDPGEWGVFRYVGNVRGTAPLALLPPISDREGNAYILFGSLASLEVDLFVGQAGGGWWQAPDTCSLIEGNTWGAHGFVGRGQNRAWLWSGDALVGVMGIGVCHRVLEYDPSSGARLLFRAVVPWVRQTPSRTTTLAWIQSPTDSLPFQAVIDLEHNVYTYIERFEPKGATDVAVLGVGGNLDDGEGVILVRYSLGGSVRSEARFVDWQGTLLETTSLGGLETLPEYGFVGYLQSNDGGLYAGLDVEGQLLIFDKSGGKRRGVGGMTPLGVHEWQGDLYVVGESNGKPRYALIDNDGVLGKANTWEASLAAASNLGKSIQVIDDRSLPSREVTWRSPRTAMGNHPFVHPHRLDHYADETTTWLVAGPSFSAGGEDYTAIAYAPVGVTYLEE